MKKVFVFLSLLFLIFQESAMSYRVAIKKKHKRDQARHCAAAAGDWHKRLGMATCCALLFSAQVAARTTPALQSRDIMPVGCDEGPRANMCLVPFADYRELCGGVVRSKKITFVTQNPHKLLDAQKLLPDFEIERIDFEVPEIQSLDPHEVIKHKLAFAFSQVQKPCFVMDTSLFFDCLNHFPGPLIKWWFEKTVGAEKTCQIAKLFGQYGCTCTTVLGYFDGHEMQFLEETIRGTISETPRGTNGFHWDTIFIPEGATQTFAEMTFEEKQSYAVTNKLLKRLRAKL